MTKEYLIPEKFETELDYLLYLQLLFNYDYARKNIKSGSKVLDVGCGEGYGANYLNVFEVCGVDSNKKAINKARKKYRNCTFFVDDAMNLHSTSRSYDAIVSFQVIEHLPTDVPYLRGMFQALKKGGKLFLATPNGELRVKKGEKPWNMFHYREYTPESLQKELEKYFRKVKVYGVRATNYIETLENNRVQKSRFIGAMDFYDIKHMIPSWLKHYVHGCITFLLEFFVNDLVDVFFDDKKQNKFNQQTKQRFNLQDYRIVKRKKDVEKSINLYAVCEK